MKRKTTKNQTTNKRTDIPAHQSELPTTLMGHLNELKNRLFWVVLFFIASAVAVFPFFDQINAMLIAPLNGEALHFFTPAGGLSFIIKICLYLGVIGALPAFVYHMYKFVQPVMTVKRQRTLVGYTLASIVLAIAGIAFTYTIVLPAAVNFLTNIDIAGVDPVLSIDSYIAFVIAYIVAGALLFQLPLIMLLINGITPLTPSKLLSYERHVIIGAFIAGALLSPTPDVVNQALLAVPLIVMYQIGVVLVVVKNSLARKKQPAPVATSQDYEQLYQPDSPSKEQPAVAALPRSLEPEIAQPAKVSASQSSQPTRRPSLPPRTIDGVVSSRVPRRVDSLSKIPERQTRASMVRTAPRTIKANQPRNQRPQSVDGFFVQTAAG